MADIFAILGQASAPRNALSSSSIEDLQNHLRGLLESNVTPAKAERVSFTFEITSGARFTVSLSQSENDALEGTGSADASDGAELSRIISANDTIMNQPQDNPTLQRIVAKHIIGCVGSCDGSSWAVREMSRGPKGWSFTYICKDSMQSWRRQSAKSMEKIVVCDYTEKERDPVSSSRPAFDCNGTVVISFSTNSRNITVKYKHTPFHKTVADLLDHFAPPPPPILPPVVNATPKSSRKRDRPNGDGASGSRKKPRTRKGAVEVGANVEGAAGNEAISANEASVVDGQGLTGLDKPDGTQQPKPKRKRPPRPKNASKEAATGEPSGPAQAAGGSTGQGGANILDSIVNVDTEEAARRREKAIELLTGAGVDPETLTADQFNIFANQSPTLQQESLAMLVQYGAERLRIVHPNKDSSAQNTSQSQTAPVAASTSTSTVEAATTAEPQAGTGTTVADARSSGTKRPRLTRGSCTGCRGKKGVKCGREKPACQNCIDAGIECSYPLQQNRGKKRASNANAGEEANDMSMMDDTQLEGETTHISNVDAVVESADLPTTNGQLLLDRNGGHDWPDQLDNQNDTPNETFMDSHHHDTTESIQAGTYPPPEPTQLDPVPYPEQVAVHPPPRTSTNSPKSRRSLPSARQHQESNERQPVVSPRSPATPSWGTVNPSSLAASHSQTEQTTTPTPPPAPTSQTYSYGYQDIQQVAALSSAVLKDTRSPQAQVASLQQQTRGSPYPAAAAAAASNPRTKSRQAQRRQNGTPIQEATHLCPPIASASQPHPPPQQSSVATRQATPAGGATYQNHLRNVSNAPATKSPDVATYNAASSLTGLGNYGFGNFPSQNENDQGTSRIGYEPYSNHPGTGNQAYSSQENFSRPGTTSARMPASSTQTSATGYSATSTEGTSRWSSQGATLSSGSSTAVTTSYSHPSTTTQSAQSHYNLPNVAQTTSSNPYSQKPRQTQQSYPTFNAQSQSQTQRSAQQHAQQRQRPTPQQQQQQQQSQQSWYGFGSVPTTQEDYRSARNASYTASYSHHGSLGMTGQDSGDNDPFIDLLSSVHHRS
ncbi:uncharacterized protein DNG_02533 [Cephalotrichum gorgonifer]|uniref:Zn(2)-C6 fungal-type domain-containing protein n=1 Tax=Cephalotrichum gorgonifer TaxID=2041049 RepID=A0AAE8SSQ4_9PEZI|nr:uncharacterized protein DNG_02533 [Cephalotrichum gorgonifer]